ncbi:flagellin N-terminal helical domain-containing protein [Clostridium cagae]|uniref:flagellin N-terminal helical domain-containing protein n=1 Tax=Clostridium TaxID=1485 RepID=UPI002377F142
MKKTNNNKFKSIEKLSSGMRINKAADDSSGLGFSQNMKAQIRGLILVVIKFLIKSI